MAVAYALVREKSEGGHNFESGSVTEPRTSLTITYAAPDNDANESFTLMCDPVGGNHPEPQTACAVVNDIDLSVFEPVPGDKACTLIYGGPQTASVVGHIGQRRVDAKFSRTNGCEIARWNAIDGLLPNGPSN